VTCANDAGLGYLINNAEYFANAAANLILKISGAEGTSPELLAVTMMNEGIPGFNMYSIPNTNPNSKGVDNPNHYGWDYGPFGLNGHYVLGEILAGNYNIHGIDLDAAFGILMVLQANPSMAIRLRMDGLLLEKLNWLTNKHGEEKAAGLYTGGSRVGKRMESYRNYAVGSEIFSTVTGMHDKNGYLILRDGNFTLAVIGLIVMLRSFMPFWRCKLILFLMIGALVSVSCCTKNQPSSPPSYSQPSRQESPSSSNEPTVTPPPVTPTNRIRTIDFRNLHTIVSKVGLLRFNQKHGRTKGWRDGSKRSSEGNEPRSFEFVNVAYADLTGDDREEAVVTLP